MAAIAFIGLGQMGSPMASNLLQQGHQLRVFDVNAEAVRHLVDKGATPAANPAQAAKDAEFIITMLPNGDLVRNVVMINSVKTAFAKAYLPMRWSLICPPSIRCKPIN